MNIEFLKAEMIIALKNGETQKKLVLSNMIDAIQKAVITPKGRIELTEQLVDETLIKYQKSIQEQVDTCPANRTDLLDKYTFELNVVKNYAPQLISNEDEIKTMIVSAVSDTYTFDKKNKGQIMRLIAPVFKGKADMGIVNKVIGEMLQ